MKNELNFFKMFWCSLYVDFVSCKLDNKYIVSAKMKVWLGKTRRVFPLVTIYRK